MSEAAKGDKNHNYGKRANEKTKKKMSEAKKGEKNYLFGKTLSDETKKKISDATKGENNYWYGKTHTEESKQKMSEAQLGKTHTEESKQKMSEAQRGDKHHKSKRVYQYDLEGNFIGSFGSNGEAARYIKQKDCSSINKCVHGKLKKTYGFRWSYEPPFAN
jgi:group I intron endonuclease